MEFIHNFESDNLSDFLWKSSYESNNRLFLISPYVGNNSHYIFSEHIKEIEDIKIIIDFNDSNIISGATNPYGVRQLYELGNLKSIKNLHAKIFIFDDCAIIGSINLSQKALNQNIEAVVKINKPTVLEKVETFFDDLWKRADPVYLSEIQKKIKLWDETQQSRTRGTYFFNKSKKRSVEKIRRWKSPVKPRHEDFHMIMYVNWSPHNFEKACSTNEKLSNEQRVCCRECKDCYYENWSHCGSSLLFKRFEYSTISKEAVKRGRLAFFIARNPKIKNNYYLVGILYIISSEHIRTYHGVPKRYFFKGSDKKSVRFPDSGSRIVIFDKDIVNALTSVMWNPKGRKKFNDDAGYIGSIFRYRHISNQDAIYLLKISYQKTNDDRIKKILEDDFGIYHT